MQKDYYNKIIGSQGLSLPNFPFNLYVFMSNSAQFAENN